MEKMKLLITREIPNPLESKLAEFYDIEVGSKEKPLTKDELKAMVKDKDALITLLSDPIDREVLENAHNLKIIAQYAVGYDNIDVEYAAERGIVVTNTPGVLTETTADTAWTLLMATARRIIEADRYVREGRWKYGWGAKLMLGRDVYGKKIGIVGLGRIGAAVARRAKGFNMEVYYYNRTRKPELEKELGLKYVELKELLRKCDFVSLHLPLTKETMHLIGENELKSMKKTAFLINTARGKVVDENALIKALEEGWIQGAGLDVFYQEPVDPNSKLLKLSNVVLAPHIGSGSVETREKMAEMVSENLIAFAKGEEPSNRVV
ncbi:MAG: glyoxylate reductase [Candidatus Odinarchaeia archaeon]